MKKKIIISIVTPSYNQGEFISETIQSVISQEGNFYIDYIIMDGNSSDNSIEIIKKYENKLKVNAQNINMQDLTFYKNADTKCLEVSYR